MNKISEKDLKSLGEYADYWLANPDANKLLVVGEQIFLDDDVSKETAYSYSINSGYDVIEVKRPK